MFKYVTNSYSTEIEKIEIERETNKSVWVKGRLHAKQSSWSNYFDTFEEAKQHLLDNVIRDIGYAEKRFKDLCNKRLEIEKLYD